jgi:hypothetical protein
MRLRGTLPRLVCTDTFRTWLVGAGVLLKDFGKYTEDVTKQIRNAVETQMKERGRPVEYLNSYTDKETLVQKRLSREGAASSGLVCALSTLENCSSYNVIRNPKTGTLQLRQQPRKCLHYYIYSLDDRFGLSHVRFQTWFPFDIRIVLNGREWLARDLDREGIGYQRRDNCFAWIEDFARAQALADAQARICWEDELNRLVEHSLPPLSVWLPNDWYYWTAEQTEWATDLAFRNRAALARIYPQLVRRAIDAFGSEDVLRFLGRRVTAEGCVPAYVQDEIASDLRHRPEGTRIKHRAGRNTIKLYDKQGSVLRVETTLNEIKGLKSYRTASGEPEGKPSWRPMRKSVVEMPRRAELSQASNDRYGEALAGLPLDVPLGRVAEKLCRAVTSHGRRYRALNPLAADDCALLKAVSQGEWAVTGFRNRDIREALNGQAKDDATRRRQSGRVTRQLGLLRAHGLIKKIPNTHRYVLTTHGTCVVPSLLTAANATVQQLTPAA